MPRAAESPDPPSANAPVKALTRTPPHAEREEEAPLRDYCTVI
jgi:hypothetical protein